MPLAHLRVELPTHNFSLDLPAPPPHATVQDLKASIHTACTGQPRQDSQRLIWRGRLLKDDERIHDLTTQTDDETLTIHLSVRPDGWTTSPPNTPPSVPRASRPVSMTSHIPYNWSTRSQTQSPSHPPAQVTHRYFDHQRLSSSPSVPPPLGLSSSAHASSSASPQLVSLGFITYAHQNALAALLSGRTPPPLPSGVVLSAARTHAQHHLAAHGWSWPAIFDQPYPPDSSADPTLKYEYTIIDGQDYLKLVRNGIPTDVQTHALRVLSHTFPLLHVPPMPVTSVSRPHDLQILNDRLRELGIQGLRVQDQAAAVDIRVIHIRPLLVPLFLLVLRTAVVLWFFAPARKPVITIALTLWFIYEMWKTIRHAFQRLNPADRPAAQAQPAPAQQGQVPAAPQGVPAQPDNGAQPRVQEQQQLRQQQHQPRRSFTERALENASRLSLSDEDAALEGRVRDSPRLGRRVYTFLCLLIFTAYPAYWDRRRALLRQREGRIRTELRARQNLEDSVPIPNEGQEEDELTRRANETVARARAELTAAHERRAQWVQDYVARVGRDEWVDE